MKDVNRLMPHRSLPIHTFSLFPEFESALPITGDTVNDIEHLLGELHRHGPRCEIGVHTPLDLDRICKSVYY